ncbi:hypothetical protein [Actinokineospora spheciospongiae]|uniref:hypothetical protein n=1 Tax=Actinokineospora spheciospongiae TaxID=909613 RepID=UPI000D80F700|nr:hypothetical protein [Actinokineospora spheciospongiae]PWW62286.1 hypothetical protein DFQ13_10596 [Actinokineospora spheciospongiae]
MGYYDDAQHAGDTGHALFDLAISDHSPTEARARLTAAVDGHTAEFTRSKAISSIKLASLTMATGDPAEAIAIGIAALDTAGTIRSCRAADMTTAHPCTGCAHTVSHFRTCNDTEVPTSRELDHGITD